MSRLLRGGILLLILLLLAQGASRAVLVTQIPIAQALNRAAEQLLAGDEQGYEAALQAKAAWEKTLPWLSAFAGHAGLEEIDVTFARLLTLKPEDAAACCAELGAMVQAVLEDHRLSLQSFL